MYFHYTTFISHKREYPLHKADMYQVCLKLTQCFESRIQKIWTLKDDNEKAYNDDGQRTNFDLKSSHEPLTQVSLKEQLDKF